MEIYVVMRTQGGVGIETLDVSWSTCSNTDSGEAPRKAVEKEPGHPGHGGCCGSLCTLPQCSAALVRVPCRTHRVCDNSGTFIHSFIRI